jgi:hypothetical protein
MKKSTANILCIFFDLFALAMVYFAAYRPLNVVFLGIANRAAFITYTTSFYIGFGSIAIPMLHVIGLIETYFPKYFNRSVYTKVFYGSVVLFLLIGFGTAATVKQLILKKGYSYCQGAAVHRKLLRIETYVLDEKTCRLLTEEKKSRSRAALR